MLERGKWHALRDWVIFILGTLAAGITIVDSYKYRGIVFDAIQSGEPIIVALVVLQTSWLLSAILIPISLIIVNHRRGLNKVRGMGTIMGSLIASFLTTWGIRALYFAITGQTYPGEEMFEFRIQTFVAGLFLLVFAIAFFAASVSVKRNINNVPKPST